ncbi:MAG: cell division protein FtsZ [Chloroflexi bacterium]|nr:cell division protein FtsZ [Chloroflexota bacterium]
MTDLSRPVQVVPQIVDSPQESPARGFTEVRIIGVGGGGSNAVNRMVETGVQGVEFIAVNTDAQALQLSSAMRKIAIGGRSTRGLGAGGDPQQGERAAEISRDALTSAITGADMVFLTAGLGGGTGTGAAPIIADIARRERALTVAVVTMPFTFEGYQRRRAADEGLVRLRDNVDALIVIPNDRLLQMADRQMSLIESFRLADDVLRHGVQGISDLVTMTGLINLDFADVKAVMQNAGTALMAVGEGRGDGRAMLAARAAISSPLLDVSIDGARGVLLNVSGGPDLTLAEVTEAAETIQASVDPDASIYFGAVIHPRQQDEVRVTVIATGLRDATRPTQAPPTRERDVEPPPRSRYVPSSEPPPSREPAREPDYDRPTRRPGTTEWERGRSRQEPRPAPPPSSPPSQAGDDDWDAPAYLRRPRR